MRLTTMALAVTWLGACQSDEIRMSHMSTLQEQTRGVVVMDHGLRIQAAMQDTTCIFRTLDGGFIRDHDLPTNDERIVDTYDGEILGASAQGIHLVNRGEDVAITEVVDARLWSGGVVSLHETVEGCTVSWNRDEHISVPQELCDAPAITADPRDGTLFVGLPGETSRIDRDGLASFDSGADLVSWDRATQLVYMAVSGERTVWATDINGVPAWSATTPAPVTALTHMGDRGLVLLMLDAGEGEGRFYILDGETGSLNSEHDAPGSEVEIDLSQDGTTLAVTLETEVHFFDITAGGEEPKERDTVGSAPDPIMVD
ncbi:MAG TPA: hypothetical protein ENK18_23845 [Deltaproteobacteria bacterium]|nr:hypothetical protein [Deltaproteobacteria bacterium]